MPPTTELQPYRRPRRPSPSSNGKRSTVRPPTAPMSCGGSTWRSSCMAKSSRRPSVSVAPSSTKSTARLPPAEVGATVAGVLASRRLPPRYLPPPPPPAAHQPRARRLPLRARVRRPRRRPLLNCALPLLISARSTVAPMCRLKRCSPRAAGYSPPAPRSPMWRSCARLRGGSRLPRGPSVYCSPTRHPRRHRLRWRARPLPRCPPATRRAGPSRSTHAHPMRAGCGLRRLWLPPCARPRCATRARRARREVRRSGVCLSARRPCARSSPQPPSRRSAPPCRPRHALG
mmetsp:Transcript_21893/g.60917  ORF Transcript_21893/g.60917 Transcript_21893/m.60917 type:complete len:288 (+) Transcript_21893:547-1410(+)